MSYLGILEDKHLHRVPGTVVLNERTAHLPNETAGVKLGSGNESHIILVPQPTDDPNDPLNWPALKKLVMIIIVGFGGIMAGVYSALLNPVLGVIATDLDRSINDIAVLSGYTLLTAGASGFIVAATSKKWGKRPVFFFSSILGTIGSIVGATVLTYNGLLVARIVQGIATSTYESILVAAIADVYFVHQRGAYMAAMQFILGGVSNLVGVVCGSVAETLGWPWLFRFCVIFSGLQTILVFLFVPETAYQRPSPKRDVPYNGENIQTSSPEEKQCDQTCDHMELSGEPAEATDSTKGAEAPSLAPALRTKKSFVQELTLFSGTFCDEGLIQLLISPFAVCLNIAVFWAVVVSGGATALYVSQAISIAQIFQAPPYLLSVAGVGYLSLGPFIGALFGSIMMIIINDPIVKWCATKNNGVYEPEFRLLLAAGALLIGPGLVGFGALTQGGKTYYATASLHGLTMAGVVILATAVGGFAQDSYPDLNDDVFVTMIIFKNFLFYGFSWFINNWIAESGPAYVFYVLGGIGFAIAISTPVMYIFGKRYRSFWARNNLLKKLRIQKSSQQTAY